MIRDLDDPIVLDPPGFEEALAWKECRDYVDGLGGLTHDDGEVNWRAAFGADPGICSCPVCKQSYWAWGKVQKCKCCCFKYVTDHWCMYSWGASAGSNVNLAQVKVNQRYYKDSKWFRWAFDNKATPTPDAFRLHEWWAIFPEDVGSTPEDCEKIRVCLLEMKDELVQLKADLQPLLARGPKNGRHHRRSIEEKIEKRAYMAARIRAMVACFPKETAG